jgi:hypothetical protein
LYAGGSKYAPREYAAEVQGMVRVLRARYGLTSRETAPRAAPGDAHARGVQQAAFDWT